MSVPAPNAPRVLIYVFATSYLFDEAEKGLCADLAEICRKENLALLEIVVDRGPPKRRASDYPVLARLARGEADLVLVVRSPLYQREHPADRLEQLCPEGPSGWLTAEDLGAAGLLSKPRKARPRRPAVERRAAALHAVGLDLHHIGQTLTTEGFRHPDGLPWSPENVAKLIGIFALPTGLENEGPPPVWQP